MGSEHAEAFALDEIATDFKHSTEMTSGLTVGQVRSRLCHHFDLIGLSKLGSVGLSVSRTIGVVA